MRSLRNAASHNVLVFLFLGVLALAIALAYPFWFDNGTKTHAAPAGSVAQQAPMPVVSQGVSVHGVPAWEHDGYTGSTIKIGIIDRDFKGFRGLMGTELPENTPILTRVHAQCYTAAGVPTDIIANCEHPCAVDCPSYVGHGTSVAEIIADVAPPTPTPTPGELPATVTGPEAPATHVLRRHRVYVGPVLTDRQNKKQGGPTGDIL